MTTGPPCRDAQGFSRALRNTSVPLVPPKPKELDMATSIFIVARRVRHVVEVAVRDPESSRLMVGGATWSRRASTLKTASTAAGRTQQVPGHGLGGTDRQLVGVVAERAA